MPPCRATRLDEDRLKDARTHLCEVFGVSTLRDYQEEAAQHIIRGQSVIYNVPTGGGKTLTFYYPLFYHWKIGSPVRSNDPVILVVSPLNALMDAQVKDLEDRVIAAVALHSKSIKAEDLFEKHQNTTRIKYRVIFVSPERALDNTFHEKVLKRKAFKSNCKAVVVDEAHCISEWGGEFRPEYAVLGKLRARLHSAIPVLAASATMPVDIITDIRLKLGLANDCPHVAVSNSKPNVALSVRIMQHPQDTYGDLLFLFPNKASASAEDFPQTLIYVNSRMEAENIQDFLRKHRPEYIPKTTFEFYHRFVDEHRKKIIQEGLTDGSHLGVPATDALGMGMDFRGVRRVVLWHAPQSFSSFVQKVGRCAQNPNDIGEVFLFVTKTAYSQHFMDLDDEEEGDESNGASQPADQHSSDEEDAEATLAPDQARIAAIDTEDPAPENEADTQLTVSRRGKRKAPKSQFEVRDCRFLSTFIATQKCRRRVWDEYFGNVEKSPSLFVPPPNFRCCDNCQPELFPIEVLKVKYPFPTRAKRAAKVSEELQNAVSSALQRWRGEALSTHYPNQDIIVEDYILDDDVIEKISTRPRAVTSIDIFRNVIPWALGVERFGEEVVKIVAEQVQLHPDPNQLAREEAAQERHLNQFLAMAEKDRRRILTELFEEVYQAVYNVRTGNQVQQGRGKKKHDEEERMCQPFLALPCKTAWPIYYEVIEQPISMSKIKKLMHAGPLHGYSTVKEFVDAWRLLFFNCQTFNQKGSLIVQHADMLEDVLDAQLQQSLEEHDVSFDLLPPRRFPPGWCDED